MQDYLMHGGTKQRTTFKTPFGSRTSHYILPGQSHRTVLELTTQNDALKTEQNTWEITMRKPTKAM